MTHSNLLFNPMMNLNAVDGDRLAEEKLHKITGDILGEYKSTQAELIENFNK